MTQKIRKRMRGEGGFTLIELLVVIIIIAILAAIAIPTFLGQRQKAQDAAAKSLVRNAMTAIESAFVDCRTFQSTGTAPAGYTLMSSTVLGAIEPSITFNASASAAATSGGTPTIPGASATAAAAVDYWGAARVVGTSPDTYTVGTVSASGNKFGVVVNKSTDGSAVAGSTFVKIVGTTASSGW